jgi:peroxiredoxin
MLEQLAQKAEVKGDLKREKILYGLLATHFPDEPLAQRARRILKRLDLLQTVVTDFRGVDENGKPVDLKDFRGKVVVVFYWSDQSENKVTAMSDLINEMKKYPKSDVVFVGINMDARGEKALEYAKQSGLTWVRIVTPANTEDPLADQTPELATRFGVESAPYHLIFDREGHLVACGASFRSVKPALDKLAPPQDLSAKTAKTSS